MGVVLKTNQILIRLLKLLLALLVKLIRQRLVKIQGKQEKEEILLQ